MHPPRKRRATYDKWTVRSFALQVASNHGETTAATSATSAVWRLELTLCALVRSVRGGARRAQSSLARSSVRSFAGLWGTAAGARVRRCARSQGRWVRRGACCFLSFTEALKPRLRGVVSSCVELCRVVSSCVELVAPCRYAAKCRCCRCGVVVVVFRCGSVALCRLLRFEV